MDCKHGMPGITLALSPCRFNSTSPLSETHLDVAQTEEELSHSHSSSNSQQCALAVLAEIASGFPYTQIPRSQQMEPTRLPHCACPIPIPPHSFMHRSCKLGRGIIFSKKTPNSPHPCTIRMGFEQSDVVDRSVTVFQAFAFGINKCIGKCSFEIVEGFGGCEDPQYATQKVVGIFRVDSHYKNIFRGIGTLLMRSVIEYSLYQGAQGRVALTSTGESLGFYYKLGFRNAYLNPEIDQQIAEEIQQAQLEQRPPKDLLNDDVLIMYLPQEGIAAWQQIIHDQPIFS